MQSTKRMDDVGDADLQVFYKSKGEKMKRRRGEVRLDNVEILFLIILYYIVVTRSLRNVYIENNIQKSYIHYNKLTCF